jgi:hypothetical protein
MGETIYLLSSTILSSYFFYVYRYWEKDVVVVVTFYSLYDWIMKRENYVV